MSELNKQDEKYIDQKMKDYKPKSNSIFSSEERDAILREMHRLLELLENFENMEEGAPPAQSALALTGDNIIVILLNEFMDSLIGYLFEDYYDRVIDGYDGYTLYKVPMINVLESFEPINSLIFELEESE